MRFLTFPVRLNSNGKIIVSPWNYQETWFATETVIGNLLGFLSVVNRGKGRKENNLRYRALFVRKDYGGVLIKEKPTDFCTFQRRSRN